MRLRFLAQVGPRSTGFGPDAIGDEISFIPLESVWSDERFDPTRAIEFGGDIGSYNPVEEGDLLVPKVSPTFAHGRATVARSLIGGRALATSEVFVVRPADPSSADFIKYRLLSEDFISEGVASWTGVAGLKRVSSEFLKNVRIDEKAWDQREAISSFLNGEVYRARQLVLSARRCVELLVESLTSLVLERVMGLDAPRVRIGSRYSVSSGKTLDEKTEMPSGERFPFLSTFNVQWGAVDVSNMKTATFAGSERYRLSLRKGDLLVCEGGEIGRAAVLGTAINDVFFQNHLHRLRAVDPSLEHPEFMRWCLFALVKSGELNSLSSGATIANLSASRLRGLFVPKPDKSQQVSIARELCDAERAVHDRIELISHIIRRAEAYQRSLITEAVSGELVISPLSDAQLAERFEATAE